MPKVFSEAERAYIDRRLQEEAAYCLATFGIKGTTVDMLVKRVNIPKGTFYLFYESKEVLLFQALLTLHQQVEQEIIQSLKDLEDKRDVEAVTDTILAFFQAANHSGLLRLLTTGELEIIYRKLPSEQFQAHLADDASLMNTIFTILEVSGKEIDDYATAFRSLFVTMIYRKEVGEHDSFLALRLCIRGLVLQLFE